MIVGIDLSTFAIDYVKINEDQPTDTPEWRRCELTGDDACTRSLSVLHLTPEPWNDWWSDVSAIGIEEPYGRWVVGKLYRVQGLVIGRLPRVPLDRWMPGEWRKANGLKGNATKETVATYAATTLGSSASNWPQDACDAWCVARAMALRMESKEDGNSEGR